MIRILLPLIALTGAAEAACPTADDMTRGIKFTSASGEYEAFHSVGADMVEGMFGLDSHQGSRTMLARGLYLVEVVAIENGKADPATRSTYSFPLPPSEMPLPVPDGGWSVTVATFADGRIGSEKQIYSFGQLTRQTYQACSYDMMPITIRYPDENDPQRRDVLHYLPELGISYLAEFHDRDASDIYDYISIETSQ